MAYRYSLQSFAGVYCAGLLALLCFVGVFARAASPFAVDVPRIDLGSKSSVPKAGVRLLSWNVKVGALFPSTMPVPQGEEAGLRQGSFGRVLRAVQPDVICLQEIWPMRDQSAIQALLDHELPLVGGRKWKLHRAVDVVIASHHPLRMRDQDRVIHYPLPQMPDFHYGQALCLVDLPDSHFSRDLLVCNTHFRSHGGDDNIRLREKHSMSILKRLASLRAPGGATEIPAETPFLVVGDLNVYQNNKEDPLRHLRLLIDGNEESNAEGASGPDWDGTALGDVLPRVNGVGSETYTWRNDTLPYPPGALDRILFSDSVLDVAGAFVLKPDELEAALLQRHSILSTDANLAGREGVFDHLPIVVDFVAR